MCIFKRKNKEEKLNWESAARAEIKAFREIGEKFNYLGIEMIVTSHHSLDFCGESFSVTPCIKADYVDKHGVVRQIEFGHNELVGLKSENPIKDQ